MKLRTDPAKASLDHPARRWTLRGPCASAGSPSPTVPQRRHCCHLLLHAQEPAQNPRWAPPERRRTRYPSWCLPITWDHDVYLVVQQSVCVSKGLTGQLQKKRSDNRDTPSRKKVSAKQRQRTTPDRESSADRGSILRCTGATSSCSARAALASWT